MSCCCGKFYVGRTQQNLNKRLQQHKNTIDCSLRHNKRHETFESAIAEHVYNFHHHNILSDQTKIVDVSVRLLQNFREIIEIKNTIYGGISINRDEGDFKIISFFTWFFYSFFLLGGFEGRELSGSIVPWRKLPWGK